MHPSSTLCRAQEAHYRSRADGAALANVRVVAEKAATAWAREAVVAERREARREGPEAPSVSLSLLAPELGDPEQGDSTDGTWSENPDRGLADN
jgi:hypothetical protein